MDVTTVGPVGRANLKGIGGVYYRADRGKWQAAIWIGGKRINLGFHKCLFEAAAARKSAEIRLDYVKPHTKREVPNSSRFSEGEVPPTWDGVMANDWAKRPLRMGI
jgi:hypothetical protein